MENQQSALSTRDQLVNSEVAQLRSRLQQVEDEAITAKQTVVSQNVDQAKFQALSNQMAESRQEMIEFSNSAASRERLLLQEINILKKEKINLSLPIEK